MIFRRKDWSKKVLKKTILEWWNADPFTQSAAVAYYTIFSFPALVILYLAFASFFLHETELKQQVFSFLSTNFGSDSGATFKTIIENTTPSQQNPWAFVFAGCILVYAALRLFLQLQKALNHIWEIDDREISTFRALVLRRFVSFAVMIGVLFALTISLILTSAITSATAWIVSHLPNLFAVFAHLLNLALSLAIISGLFAVILKKLPDIELPWPMILPGATLSGMLFMFGEYALGIYFSTAEPGSAYGVTGAVLLLMIWVFYSCSILLLGAEYNKQLFVQRKAQTGKAHMAKTQTVEINEE